MKTEQQPVVPVWDNRTRTAKRGGFSVKKLDEWIKEGKVETRKFGLGHKGILVRWASVEALIESMPRHQPAAQISEKYRQLRAQRKDLSPAAPRKGRLRHG